LAGTKLLRGNYSVYAFYPEAQTNWASPTAAQFTSALAASPPLGFDISCAITDDSVNINLTDSDTDDSLSICDIGNVATPTFFNYEVSFDSFRNGPASAGTIVPVYEIPVNLFNAPDRPFYIVTRIGPAQGTAFAAGQIVNIFGVNTDYPVDVLGDGENILFGSRFKANGQVYTNATLA
jgi:hypothetical protein